MREFNASFEVSKRCVRTGEPEMHMRSGEDFGVLCRAFGGLMGGDVMLLESRLGAGSTFLAC